MYSFSRLSGCVLSVAVTAGLSVDVLASEFTRERAASAMYGKIPADQRMMRSERAAVPPWFRMSPSDFASRAGQPVWPVPPRMPMQARAPRQPVAPVRFQRPVPPPAFNNRPMPQNTAARIAQYRQPMPPPAPMWARAPQRPALAHFQRPVPPPAFNSRLAAQHAAARIAQYRQPMPHSAPMWARAPRQVMASPSSRADTRNLQAHDDMGQSSETAELAAFESSPSDSARLQAENGDSDDMGQASESTKVEELVAEVPPLLARPAWMKKVADGS